MLKLYDFIYCYYLFLFWGVGGDWALFCGGEILEGGGDVEVDLGREGGGWW